MVPHNHLQASRIPTALLDLSQQTPDSTHGTAHASSQEGTAPVRFNIMQDVTIGNLTEDNDQLKGELIASKDQLDLLETRKQVEQLMEEVKRLKAGLVVAKKERKNTPETQKLIDHLTKENSRLEKGHTVAMERLKAQAALQTMIDKLIMENKDLKEQLYAQK
jgi:hypothetical protein